MSLDARLFRWLNTGTANPLFDGVMPFLTGAWCLRVVLVTVVLVAAAGLWRRGERALAGRLILTAILGVALAELLGSHLLRHWVARPRPPRALPDVRLLVGLGPSFSFPSAHAANSAAVAAAVGLARPRWALPMALYAATIAYSRVYVGVHYPGDVLAGAVIGVLCSLCVWRLAERVQRRAPAEAPTSEQESDRE